MRHPDRRRLSRVRKLYRPGGLRRARQDVRMDEWRACPPDPRGGTRSAVPSHQGHARLRQPEGLGGEDDHGSVHGGSGLPRSRLEPRRRVPPCPPGGRARQRENLRNEPVRPRGSARLLPRDRLGRGDRRNRRVPEGSDADHGPVFPGRRGGPCPLRRLSRRDAGPIRDRSRTRRPVERHPHG